MRNVFSDRGRLAAMLRAEWALAAATAEAGLTAPALAAALERIDADMLDAGAIGAATALAGVPTIPFVAAVRRLLPPDLEPDFHKGATTQDILDTALALQMREAFGALVDDLTATLAALAALARRHRADVCAGRTYGQHAAPVTFGAKVGLWGAGLADVAARMETTRTRACVAALGGPTGLSTQFGPHAARVGAAFARHLGLATAPFVWHALRGRMAETGFFLAELVGALAKMATDIAHLASTEVSEVAEPYVSGRGGSSAMPHKRNPVSCVAVLAAHAVAGSHVATLLDAMAVLHERGIGQWHAEWLALPPLFGLASGALREARALAEGLVVDTRRMRDNLEATRGLVFSDAAAAALSRHIGADAAHRAIEEAAAETRATGRHLRDVVRARPDCASASIAAEIDAAFDPADAIGHGAAVADRAADAIEAAALSLRTRSDR